jgi:DNA-binding beta-propeller fold protein YncE
MALVLLLIGCPAPTDTVALAVDAGPDIAVPVGEPVTLTTGGEGAVSWEWNLGEDTVLSGGSVTHTYSEPGNYGVVLTATAESGQQRTDAITVTVYSPAADVLPVVSGTLAIDEARGLAWSVIADTHAVVQVDLATGVLQTVATCLSPRTVFLDAGTLWVACESDDSILAIPVLDSGAVTIFELPSGSRPHSIVARDGVATVTLQGTGQLAQIDGNDVVYTAIGADPRAVVLLPDGAVWTTRFRSELVGEVYRTGRPTLPIDRATGTDSDTKSRGVPALLQSLAISPDGHTVWVGGQVSNTDRGTYRDGQALTFESTVRAILRGYDVSTDASLRAFDRQLDDQGHAGPLAVSPLGDQLFVAHPGSGIVQILDGYSGAAMSTLLQAGIGLTDMVVSADGQRLWSHAEIDREIRVFDLTDTVRQPLPIARISIVEDEPLTAEQLLGKRLFHDASDVRLAKDGYVSCASCHPDGRDDGLTWDFTDRGEGIRNTTSLEGRSGTGMGPLHWTGNFNEIQDFELDIRHGFGGTGLLTDDQVSGGSLGASFAGLSEDLDALAAYVATFDQTPVSPTDAPDAGRELFEAKGCDTCHAGALYTDSAVDVRHDVGTWQEPSGGRLSATYDGFDTPTLLGAWSTAPYLHDGSASTIQDAIDAHRVGGLMVSADEASTLAAFVRSL